MSYPPNDPFMTPSDAPPPKKSTKGVWLALGIVVLACLAFCGVGAIVLGSSAPVQEDVQQERETASTGLGVPDSGIRPSLTPPKPKPKPSTKSTPEVPVIGDGTYLVGEDIPAGTWKAKGAEESAFQYCGWTVRSGEGSDADWVDAGSASKTSAPQRVKLKAGQVFETMGCGDWKRS